MCRVRDLAPGARVAPHRTWPVQIASLHLFWIFPGPGRAQAVVKANPAELLHVPVVRWQLFLSQPPALAPLPALTSLAMSRPFAAEAVLSRGGFPISPAARYYPREIIEPAGRPELSHGLWAGKAAGDLLVIEEALAGAPGRPDALDPGGRLSLAAVMC